MVVAYIPLLSASPEKVENNSHPPRNDETKPQMLFKKKETRTPETPETGIRKEPTAVTKKKPTRNSTRKKSNQPAHKIP